jgi:hypothetical protein
MSKERNRTRSIRKRPISPLRGVLIFHLARVSGSEIFGTSNIEMYNIILL